MGFSRKRGRPTTKRNKTDEGTIELRKKKTLNLTAEPLDLCFKKNLITTGEQEAGIRLRWLYTLRFGSPDISSYNPDMTSGTNLRSDDETWLQARQNEYNHLLSELERINAKRIVMNICVFNQIPEFLKKAQTHSTKIGTKAIKSHIQFIKFKDGLELMEKNFKQTYRKK